jgi:GTP cyclohydrolase II/3,4-dihydroxy 2-butanone 4-phosphate synthase/GTP cyclohydrolase II
MIPRKRKVRRQAGSPVPLESRMSPEALKSTELDFEWAAKTVLPVEFQGKEVQFQARAYQGRNPEMQALALIHGKGKGTPLVRVHSGCVTGDIFHSLRCDCYGQLQASLARIVAAELGVLIYLPYHEGRGIGLVNKIRAYALQDQGLDTVDANVSLGEPVDARDYDLAAQILVDLGYPDIRLLTNNPAKLEALREKGINVVEQQSLIVEQNPHNLRYLKVKKERMSHLF